MKYELLALDIDDTLFGADKRISARNLSAVRAAAAAGVRVTLATGRGYLASKPVVDELGITGAMANYGGALISVAETGEEALCLDMAWDDAKAIMDYAHEHDIYCHLYQGDTVVYEDKPQYAARYCATLHVPLRHEPELRNMRWERIPKVLYITEPARIPELMPELVARFGASVQVSMSGNSFIEFNRKDVHKASALRWIADSLGIPRERVAAMGDNTLDLEMIEWAGLGVAVDNACAQVKAAADVIAPNCESDAVAWVIERHILTD
ncbi:MAG: Cof-type HAD-IIB family hydrolase [Clostridia bacterium]|nr:Cof-type HAD-IIB family hydrolase [Clostridia bacterium]